MIKKKCAKCNTQINYTKKINTTNKLAKQNI